jgi:prepilin-type N-terminal cleavage/methylation domain-containing protein
MIQRLRQMRNEEGFTLIELLIVIIVLGILAAIVVFAIGNTRSDAVASTCKADVKSLELSAEAVKTKMGSYPGATTSANAASTNLLSGGTNGALLKSWPSSTEYHLRWNGTAVEVYANENFVNGANIVTTSGGSTNAVPSSCTGTL